MGGAAHTRYPPRRGPWAGRTRPRSRLAGHHGTGPRARRGAPGALCGAARRRGGRDSAAPVRVTARIEDQEPELVVPPKRLEQDEARAVMRRCWQQDMGVRETARYATRSPAQVSQVFQEFEGAAEVARAVAGDGAPASRAS